MYAIQFVFRQKRNCFLGVHFALLVAFVLKIVVTGETFYLLSEGFDWREYNQVVPSGIMTCCIQLQNVV